MAAGPSATADVSRTVPKVMPWYISSETSHARRAAHQAYSARSSASLSIVPVGFAGLATITPASGPRAATCRRAKSAIAGAVVRR